MMLPVGITCLPCKAAHICQVHLFNQVNQVIMFTWVVSVSFTEYMKRDLVVTNNYDVNDNSGINV